MKKRNRVTWAILMTIMLSCGLAKQAGAQLRDNDSSVDYLATQIGASAGYSSDNYQRYAEKLAKTMARLDSGQQAKIFGFMPSPSGGPMPVAGSSLAGSTTAGSGVSADLPSGVGSEPGQTDPVAAGSPHSSWWQRVKDAIERYLQSKG